jgi:hypothetical protein
LFSDWLVVVSWGWFWKGRGRDRWRTCLCVAHEIEDGAWVWRCWTERGSVGQTGEISLVHAAGIGTEGAEGVLLVVLFTSLGDENQLLPC